MWEEDSSEPPPTDQAEVFSFSERNHQSDGDRVTELQGVRDGLPAGRRASSASSASARSRSPTTTVASTRLRPSGRSRPARRASGATPTSSRSRPSARPGDPLEPGLTPLVRADRLAERLGLGEVWIKNDAANPTHSFKDRVVAVAIAKAVELGFETVACASTGQPGERRRRPRRGRRPRLLRLRPRRPRGAEAARHRHLRDQPRRRPGQLRRRQPPLHGARPDAAVGVRQRQPAALLRRGLEDARVRDDRAARLGAARPDRQPDRVGLALHPPGPRRSPTGSTSAWSRASCRPSTAPRPRAARRSQRPSADGTDVCKPQKPDTIAKSLAIGDPADGPYALELARRTGGADRLGERRRDPRRHPAARRDDRDLHRDRRRRHDGSPGEAGRARRHRAATSGSSSTSPARA